MKPLSPPTPEAAMAQGAVRFAGVSLAAYAVWAFGSGLNTLSLYTAVATVFLVLSGLLLHPLLNGSHRIRRFYASFLPGFTLYALLWCAGWFLIRGPAGEIFGAAAGLAAFVSVIALTHGSRGVFLSCLGVLFLLHSLGYTLGGMLYYGAYGRGVLAPLMEGQVTLGRLLWGLFHGAGFGAGLGYVYFFCQAASTTRHPAS